MDKTKKDRKRITLSQIIPTNPEGVNVFILTLLLTGFGLVMVYSASSYAASMSDSLGGNSYYYLTGQLRAAIVGMVIMAVIVIINSTFFTSKLSPWVWVVLATISMLSITIMKIVNPDAAIEVNGATRWVRISIGPVGMNVQPSEICKMLVIILYAKLLPAYKGLTKKMSGYAILMIPALYIAGLIAAIANNFSGAIIVVGTAFMMIMIVSYKPRLDGSGIAWLGIYIGIIVAGAVLVVMKRWNRVVTWYLLWSDPSKVDAGDEAFQPVQSLYAIGSGGIFGKGIGGSIQKLKFLPESQNDMIFSIICEETGIFGGIMVIAAFVALLGVLYMVARRVNNLHSSLLVFGVFFHIALQTVINICVATCVFPNTGVTLPFISQGGSALIMALAEIGLVLNVAKQIED